MTDRYVDYLPLDDITPANRNPKLHDDTGIRRSLGHFGFAELPLVDDRTGRLVAGHGRHQQLVRLREDGATPPDGVRIDDQGAWLMPVVRGWSSRSDDDAEAYLIASNRLTDNGGWDEYALTEVLAELADAQLLELTGYDQGDLDALEALLNAPDTASGGSDEDALRDSDRAGWPTIRAQVPPDVYDRWKTVDGDDDAARVRNLLDMANWQ